MTRPARAALLLAGLASLAVCRGGPARAPLLATDHDRLIYLMGGIDADLLEVQRGAGDPLEAEHILRHLRDLGGKLEAASRLDPGPEEFAARARRAAARVRELEGAAWTRETREEHYRRLRSLCESCHRDLAPEPSPGPPRPDSAQACGRCHERAYREWQESLHAGAWNDPVYRMSAGQTPRLECRSCHSMEPILERDISTEAGYRPLYRHDRREEGVNCLACHGLADGSVAAARDIPGAPCRPRRDDRLLGSSFCGACHNPTHSSYDEWLRSRSDKSCRDCHADDGGRFTHRMRGVRDADFIKASIAWACEIREGELRISLTNRSGHRLPAEVPSRTLRVKIDRDGAIEEHLFRRPPKQIVGSKDNRLWPDETRVLRHDVRGAKTLRVEILYQPSPLAPPQDWIVIGTWP